jgi:putative CocE/NonD family hydrolase
MSGKRTLPRRILRISLYTLAALVLLGGTAYLFRHELLRQIQGLPPFTHSAGEERLDMLRMRDGVRLATTVYQPRGEGPWPAILIRNPYMRFDIMVRSWCGRLVRYGYACVYQDVRGQGASEGEWEPLVNEGSDGEDTLRWLAAQQFQDGNIAMIGPSYLAAVQWAAAADLPPEVKTFVPSVTALNLHDIVYQDGMFRHETFTAWAAMMRQRGLPRSDAGQSYQQAIRHRPHLEIDERFYGMRLPWYRQWVTSPSPSAPLWQTADSRRLLETPERLKVPILMIGGWYDVFLGPQMRDWHRLATRAQSRYLVGPWTHVGQGGPALDTPDAGGGLLQWPVLLDWIGHHLKGEPLENGPGVATYVMRENRWVTRPAWPPPTRRLRLHLRGAGQASSCDGGRLDEAAPTEREEASYSYDPDDPVPTRGGAGMLAFILPGFDGAPPATVWQEGLCERSDVLSFVSDPLEAPLHLAGAVQVALTVASDAPDTAFTARLVEVLPDGRAVNIRDGITSLAYRNGAKAPLSYTPRQEVGIAIPFWPIEWKVPAGSRLRLDVSSSDFPKYHAHTNRAGIWSEQVDAAKAEQRLLVGPELQGWVDLPVVIDSSPQLTRRR